MLYLVKSVAFERQVIDGLTGERLRLLGEVQTSAINLYWQDKTLQDEKNLEEAGISRFKFRGSHGLTALPRQIGISLLVPGDSRKFVPPIVARFLPDVVDPAYDLRATLILDDWEADQDQERSASSENREFGMILRSDPISPHKVAVGIPSDPHRGLFVVTPQASLNQRQQFYRSQVGYPVDSVFWEVLAFGSRWLMGEISSRIYFERRILDLSSYRGLNKMSA